MWIPHLELSWAAVSDGRCSSNLGGQLPICPAQPGCSALPVSLRVKANSVWKKSCAWFFLPCSTSNHMKVSVFYFEKEEKTPSLQVFVCVCCFSSLVLVLMAGVKNTCRVNLEPRHQGLWLTKKITFLCILWILKGHVKISWYVLRTEYVCPWELLRLDDYQNYVSLEAKPKSQRVKVSQVTANVWVWHRFMPKYGALTVHMVREALTLLFPELHQESKGQKKKEFSRPLNLWNFKHFSNLEGLRRGRDFSEWKQYLGQPKHLIWIFTAFFQEIITMLIMWIKNTF